MFGMNPATMLRAGLQMVDLNDQKILDAIADELRKMEWEEGEKEKVITLLRVALGALGAKGS